MISALKRADRASDWPWDFARDGWGPVPSRINSIPDRFRQLFANRTFENSNWTFVQLDLGCSVTNWTFLLAEISLSECADCHSVGFFASPVVHTMAPWRNRDLISFVGWVNSMSASNWTCSVSNWTCSVRIGHHLNRISLQNRIKTKLMTISRLL